MSAVLVAPHNLEAEQCVLGAILVDDGLLTQATAVLEPTDFFREAHRRIFTAMGAVRAGGQGIDLVTVRNELARSGDLEEVGPAYISTLIDGVPRSANVAHYAGIVRDHSRQRQVLRALVDAQRDFEDGQPTRGLTRLRAIAELVEEADDEVLLEPLCVVADRVSAAPRTPLIAGLIPAFGRVLGFGLERCFKSIFFREVAVSLAMGRPALGLDRMHAIEAVPVAYLTGEDGEGAVLRDFDAFSGGQGRDLPIVLNACRGLNLDDLKTQDRLIRQVAMSGARVVIAEPLRSLTACVDRTTSELQPFTQFLRRLEREAGPHVQILGHHAVKPTAGPDQRRGAQRVSGGGLFSICEAPIEFERLDEDRVLIRPLSWKYSAAPSPVVVHLEVRDGQVARIVAEEYADTAMPDPWREAADRLLATASQQPGLSKTRLVTAAGVQKATGLQVIRQLHAQGRLRLEPRRGQGGGEALFVGSETGSGTTSEPVPR